MQSMTESAIGNVEAIAYTHENMLFRICLVMLGNEKDAEDALQETLLKYMQKAPVFQDFEHEKAWLITVATNQCRDMLRFRLRHPQVELDYIKSLPTTQEGSEIMEALMMLPEKFRTVLLLHYVEEYKVEEIATMIGKTASAVKMRLQKGRKLLEEQYCNMDMNLMKNTLKDIKVPEGMHERLMQNCQKAKKSKPSYAAMYRAVAAVLVVAILVTSVVIWKPWDSATVYAQDLMEGITPNEVEAKEPNIEWIQAVADFSIELFKNGQTVDENSLISPLSVYLTLAMTANGADGETLTAFEQVLGNGISTDDINLYVYSLLQRLCKEEQDTLKINNSLWFDENRVGSVYKTFLQKNADYYGADAFQVDFGKEKDALNKVNNWAFQAIDGEVEKILEQVNPDTAMLLINTILFDSDWAERYYHKTTAPFQNANKEWVTVKMLKGEKKYIENENATGFISEYKDEQYSFVALLPNEGMTLEEYVSGLTGEEFLEIVDVNTEKNCLSYLPEFTYAYKMDLAGALKNMRMEPAFGSNSDFSNLAKNGKQPGQIYLSQVEQQAFIQLDEEGTKAGAVTVETLSTLGGEPSGGHYVFLNRPFLYAIIDNETELPIFLGTVNQLEGETTDAQAYSTYVEEKDGVTYRVVNSTEQFTSVIKGPEDTTCVDFDCFDGPLYKITYIEPYAYADNKNLEEVNFLVMDYANGLTIGEGAFANCPNLKKVFFSTDMGIFDTTIEKGAFAGSEQVVLYMPDFVDSEGSEAQVYLDAVEQGIPVILYNPSDVQ